MVACDQSSTPQQQNSYDCGIFITMYADFLLDDLPIHKFSQSDISYFRQKICLNIIKGSLPYSI